MIHKTHSARKNGVNDDQTACSAGIPGDDLPIADRLFRQSRSKARNRLPAGTRQGTYAGKTIEMSYAFLTDIDCSRVNFYKPRAAFQFVNGHVLLEWNDNQQYVYLDTTGNVVGGDGYRQCEPFDANGHALVQLADGSWVYINANGETVKPGADPYTAADTRPSGSSVNVGEGMYLYDG